MDRQPRNEGRRDADSRFVDQPRQMDLGVQAALSRRAREPRSFGNEDDVEGQRPRHAG